MKKILLFVLMASIILPFAISKPTANDYVVLAWNEQGMNFYKKDFSMIALLPPGNNIYAQVIKKGDYPKVITSGIKVTYEIPGNTRSDNKINFWTYAQKLFGVSPAANIGLKGAGLSGNMTSTGNYFLVEGVPVTPYQDTNLTTEDPYQQAVIKVYDTNTNELLATTTQVIPVSNEIGCLKSGCHSTEAQILNNHGEGISAASAPVLCAKCHASNAVGTTGNSEARPFSYRIHSRHANAAKNDCYLCHPGPKTQFFRDAMLSQGKACIDCHGTMTQIANTITQSGRKPWIDEPTCEKSGCHNAAHAQNSGKKFTQSTGHGNLFCSACHGSPHAITPTNNDRDNQQNNVLQDYDGPLRECNVCHLTTPKAAGPHGLTLSAPEKNSDNSSDNIIIGNYPNPIENTSEIVFRLAKSSIVKLQIITIDGMRAGTIMGDYLEAGEYTNQFNASSFSNGIYVLVLNVNGKVADSKKIIIQR